MIFKVHHVNCGCIVPVGYKFYQPFARCNKLICHCLIIESSRGIILVDTGIDPNTIPNTFFIKRLIRPQTDPLNTMCKSLEVLGYKPSDVTDVILTHLDFDHMGALHLFPEAQIHVHYLEYEYKDNVRYSINFYHQHFKYQPKWIGHKLKNTSLYSFNVLEPIEALKNDLLLIEMPGHSPGHCGVAIKQNDGWLIHCGDAYYNSSEINPLCKTHLRTKLLKRYIDTDPHQSFATLEKIKNMLVNTNEKIRCFSSHDLNEFELFSSLK